MSNTLLSWVHQRALLGQGFLAKDFILRDWHSLFFYFIINNVNA